MSMLGEQIKELREAARNIQGNLGRCLYRRKDVEEMQQVIGMLFEAADAIESLRDRLLKAERACDEKSYDAGFDNGMKATLQQLDGLIYEGADVDEIQAWADRQWEEET